ncbi:inactive protein kinase SELMODRAFT_444075 isoform X4 [Manihot esculenta]|uniref:inactive protein kinase SELMODRAFT_444075 isoform X4 n=1 Tax=Manihot esculenta TaxID=3983 RepID=UPI000B5D4249|nr:inactive protein kinase SELMODRAFT_444075 isoform X4 [Manihot esculenta]
MESHLSPSLVVIAYDATKDRGVHELKRTIDEVRMRGDILHGGDRLIVLGVLHKVPNPMGYMKVCPDSFGGASARVVEEEVTKRIDVYVNMLLQSAEVCEDERVTIEVKITAGTPMKQVILQEVVHYKATWVILDRHLRRDLKFYLKQIPCKVALIQDNLSVQLKRSHSANETDPVEHKSFYSMSKPVLLLNCQGGETDGQSVISCRSYSLSTNSLESYDMQRANLLPSYSHGLREQHKSDKILSFPGTYNKSEINHLALNKTFSRRHTMEAPILCAACGASTELYIKDAMRFTFSEIQLATEDFSKENLLGEGGYGHVYKGELKDGQLIAAKVRKEASTQGFAEFQSEVYVLNLARHKNIVMLLGFCCKENLNILVYEYICNKSLDWHLFDKAADIIDWHQRYSIATGTAKGLRFLHEECRGGPIIHRDVRPGNILLTHDFVPMLGDFGLARWKTTDEVQTRVLGTLGYLAPEYAENGIVSVRTDVYAFGIILLQLISGQKVVDPKREKGQQSLRQWAEPLIERLALHELIDQRISDSYDTYELYLMAKAALLCIQRNPEMRPSMGEIVRLLEGENNHIHYLASSNS